MQFEYYKTVTVNAILDIEDIGNFAIKAFNDKGEEYIMVVDTVLGETRMFTYGPIIPDLDLLPPSVNCSFNRINFSTKFIQKAVDTFLGGRSQITQAMEVSKEEALEDCKDIISYMKQSDFF